MPDKRKKLCLVDGANYAFRAFYAIRNLSNSKGFPTGALYGFTQMLLKLLREEEPDLIAVCFDRPEPTFRDELYKDYKANRARPPDDLIPQFPFFRPIVEALGLTALEKPGFEADDIIGTLAKRYADLGCDVVIVSGDKDLMQLIGPSVSMLDEMKGVRIGPEEVLKKFGVGPQSVVEFLGLAGDPSDNIPGIPGIGPKTAQVLIQKYGTVEGVISHADELGGSLLQKVRGNAALARISRKLVEIHTAVALDVDEMTLTRRRPNNEQLHKLFAELEFTKLIAELLPRRTLNSEEYHLVQDIKTLDDIVDKIRRAGRVSFNIEAALSNPTPSGVIGISMAWAQGKAAYIPIGCMSVENTLGGTRGFFDNLSIPGQFTVDQIGNVLRPIIEDNSISKVGYDLNFISMMFHKMGFKIGGIYFDTMLASYVIDPSGDHSLATIAQKYLDYGVMGFGVSDPKRTKKKFAEFDLTEARDFSCERADVILRLVDFFRKRLDEERLNNVFRNIEMPLLPVLVDMQLAGVRVDAVKLKEFERDFTRRLALLEDKICNAAGESFNINSPKQLGQILFEKLGLPGAKRTKTGFSTSQDILEELSHTYELPRLILEYRSLAKLKGTYVDALQTLMNPVTCRIHTTFHQAVTATGRLSSSDPNLQNIPVRTEEGRKIRESFVAEDGFVLLSADYSQIELRVLAHMSGDITLLDAFDRGEDIHAITASGLFGVSPSLITDEQRGIGKTINFATIYGQSAFGLSRQLGIDVGEASDYIGNYFRKYPRVAAYRDEVIGGARRNGKVETLFGRRRFIPDILSTNVQLKAFAERTAFNTVFQGTAADIIKRAMITIHNGLRQISPRSRMILQVHDELLFEVPAEELKLVEPFIIQEMEGAALLKVPLIVDIGSGPNWARAH